MRTHVWRKALVRLSLRNQRLPFQRRRCFSTAPARLDNHHHRHDHDHDLAAAEARTDDARADAVAKHPAGGRRGARFSRRPKDATPFAVPDWFLRHNVHLHAPSPGPQPPGEPRSWTLVDRDTGHTVLTLPFSTPPPGNKDPADFFTSSTAPPLLDHKEQESGASAEDDDRGDGRVKRALERLEPVDATSADAQPAPLPAPQTPDPRLLASLELQLLLHAAFSVTGPASSRFPKSNIDLQTSDAFAHNELDRFVVHMAQLLGAHVVRFDANDFAQLAQDHVESQDYSSGSISALAYDVYKGVGAASAGPSIHVDIVHDSPLDDSQEAQDSEGDQPTDDPFASNPLAGIDVDRLTRFLKANSGALSKALGSGHVVPINLSDLSRPESQASASVSSHSKAVSSNVASWDELKLSTLLDTLLDSPAAKRDAPDQTDADSLLFRPMSEKADPQAPGPPSHAALERFLADYLARRIDSGQQGHDMSWSFNNNEDKDGSAPTSPDQPPPPQRTIVHIHDMDHIRNAPQGEAVVNRLVRLVQRRRKDGQQMVILGTTASATQAPPYANHEDDDDEPFFRYLRYPVVPAQPSVTYQVKARHRRLVSASRPPNQEATLAKPAYHKLVDINLRNMYAMVHRLGLPASDALFASNTRSHLNIPGTSRIGEYAMSQDEVQKIVLCAESLRSLYTDSSALETFHVAFATMLLHTIDGIIVPLTSGFSLDPVIPPARPRGASEPEAGRATEAPKKLNMEQLKKSCSKHETRLLSGVVDPANLKTTFTDVHAEPATIESLKTLTSLTLLRPEAFSYGVLAADRLPGLLLYGPPGTGKTLLAKAVAKESKATVLEVSGAQIYEKYVGEGEKMVKAVFSLAKKLSPCVVFIDEADALFGSRGGANNRTTHREIINQFLREWDGMDDHGVFMMVATNRPFDLDDAVLRRLPRRLLVDLPVVKDRESILKIHLKTEALDDSVSLAGLAKNTALYSGSDLKNLCVAAALAAVREENDALSAARGRGDEEFTLPARRTLTSGHFDKALQEISASVSEDMATLGAIRKFDEQYGERRARTKKPGYGFGLGADTGPDENGARVRPDDPKR